ncbi:integrase core domain-containing protein, partial [Falsigemmobacter intermedius]
FFMAYRSFGKFWQASTPATIRRPFRPRHPFPSIALQPGKPQQNAYVERYNRTVRHEWLDLYIFDSIQEVQDIATNWLWTYNHDRPNMGIGGMTPAQKLKTGCLNSTPEPR